MQSEVFILSVREVSVVSGGNKYKIVGVWKHNGAAVELVTDLPFKRTGEYWVRINSEGRWDKCFRYKNLEQRSKHLAEID